MARAAPMTAGCPGLLLGTDPALHESQLATQGEARAVMRCKQRASFAGKGLLQNCW
jgi:hypothetical protein